MFFGNIITNISLLQISRSSVFDQTTTVKRSANYFSTHKKNKKRVKHAFESDAFVRTSCTDSMHIKRLVV